MALYDFSDKYPEMSCPACDKKMTWAKHGSFAFCFNCYTFASFSEEGLEAIYKKQGKWSKVRDAKERVTKFLFIDLRF